MSRLLRAVIGLLVLANGAVHYYQWEYSGFSNIPDIGFLFAVNAIAAAVIGVYVIARRDLLGTVIAGLFSAGTLAGYVLARTVGLFGFSERSTTTEAMFAVAVEAAALVVVIATLAVDKARDDVPPLLDTNFAVTSS